MGRLWMIIIWEGLELGIGGVATRRIRNAKDDEIEKRGNDKRRE